MHPAQQQGRRIPLFIFDIAFLIRIFLVSIFLPEVIQHIHSLRARGVISSHADSIALLDTRTSFKSAGTVCTVPLEIFIVVLLYQICYSKKL